jgi:hypothetical protein
VLSLHGGNSLTSRCSSSTSGCTGEYCFPPLASLITAAARLMLALPEHAVAEYGGTYAMEDIGNSASRANAIDSAVAFARERCVRKGGTLLPHLRSPLLFFAFVDSGSLQESEKPRREPQSRRRTGDSVDGPRRLLVDR